MKLTALPYLTAPRPQVRPTLSGAHLAPLTDAQLKALRVAAERGRVERGGGPGRAPVTILTALARKGLVRLVAHPGQRRANWAYGEITPAGRAALRSALGGTHTGP